jgi:hypothetical protein
MAYNARGELLVAGNGRLVIRSAGGDAPIETPSSKEITKPTLYPIHPNPFNPSTTISFDLPERTHLELAVYDILGRRVAILLNDVRERGSHSIQFDGSKLASGIYFCQLRTQTAMITRKMILVK